MCDEHLQHAGLAMTAEPQPMLDISPLASVIATWLKSISGLWEGTASELLEELAATALRAGQPRAVPQTAARLGRALQADQMSF